MSAREWLDADAEPECVRGTGYTAVDTPLSCVLTRFRLRSAWSLPRFYRAYQRVTNQAKDVGGLVVSVFLIEDLRTCYTLSLWSDAEAIGEFNARVRAHVEIANWSFHHLRLPGGKPHLWSAQFRLIGVSPFNFRWDLAHVDAMLESALRRGRADAA